MKSQLIFEVALHGVAAKESAQPVTNVGEHGGSGKVEHMPNGERHLTPRLCVSIELLPSRLCQLVVLRSAVVLGGFPARLDPAAPFEPMQRGIQRSLRDLQPFRGNVTQPLRNSPAVLWIERQCFQYQEIQRALWQAWSAHRSPLLLRQEG